ncbi:MAG: MaoC family dehydratase [Burkholderiaceae bacterium]|nr:MAG: MaoC family dehydratase [Burkholderiaceae bacterium]
MALYLDDLTPGMVVDAGTRTVSLEEGIAFAQQFDPQPFHLDDDAAKSSLFNGLALSGWHTAAVCMRMAVESPFGEMASGLVGLEIRSMRWPIPARPGDTLRMQIEVLSIKPSRSRPGWGTGEVRWIVRNQKDEVVMSLENTIWASCRPTA